MSPPPHLTTMLNSSSDFDDLSSLSSFNDASSFILDGEDDFYKEKEREQAEVQIVPPSHDIKTSLEIRNKYGLPNSAETPFGTPVKSKTKIITTKQLSDDPEHTLLFETMRHLTNYLLGKHLLGEQMDANAVQAFIALIEISLLHGLRGHFKTLWLLLQRLPKWSTSASTKGVLKSTEDFTGSMKSPLNKVRCWIRYALMAKTASSDLTLLINNDNSYLISSWEGWSFILSRSFQPFLALISKMDVIDFNIFFKERDISYAEVKNMRDLFGRDQMNFIQFSPPITLDWKMVTTGGGSSSSYGIVIENVLKDKSFNSIKNDQLIEENQKLRKALLSQMTERAFYQNAFTSSQSKGALLFEEQQRLSNRVEQLERQLRESLLVIDTHERTNESMQEQISMAYQNSDEQLMEKYGLLFREFSKEKIKSSSKSSAISDLQKKLERQSKMLENHRHESHMKLEEVEGRWKDRCRSLQEQLSLSNALKEKYSRALNK